MGDELKNPEPSLEKKHQVDVVMNEACLNGDEDCPCTQKEIKHDYNPV